MTVAPAPPVAASCPPPEALVPEGDRGFVLVNAELCKGCALCVLYCPPEVLAMSGHLNNRGFHPAVYGGSGCTGCSICFYVCPEPGAITVYRREETS